MRSRMTSVPAALLAATVLLAASPSRPAPTPPAAGGDASAGAPAAGAGGQAAEVEKTAPAPADGAAEREPRRRWRRQVRREPRAEQVDASHYEVDESTRELVQSGQGTLHIYQIIEEMVDDLVEDLRDLDLHAVSPVALRSLTLSPSLTKQFGLVVEAEVVSAVAASTDLVIKRCVACGALRSRLEGEDWVVSLGIVEQEALAREAERLGVRAFLDLHVAWFPDGNVVSLQAELLRARDSAVLWAETYRADETTAAVLRSGDRVQTRAERLLELERKLEARPYYGHIVYGGAAYIPYDHPTFSSVQGASLGYRVYEKFGEQRRWMFGIGAELFANISLDNPLVGSFIGGTLLYEVLPPNLNDISLRTGPTLSGFFAGQEGNSFAAEWNVDVVLQFRLGAGLSVMYFLPTELAGYDLGGFGGKARLSFNW